MGMTPEEFFEAFVLGNYEDCRDHPGCVRRAFNAAVSASHLADHYFNYYKKHDPSKTIIKAFSTIKDFIKYLSKNTGGNFKDIRSIANAYKHLYTSIDPQKAGHSTVSSTGAIESISFDNNNEEVVMVAEELHENSSETKVIVTRKDDSQFEFLPVLEEFIRYWQKSSVLYGS